MGTSYATLWEPKRSTCDRENVQNDITPLAGMPFYAQTLREGKVPEILRRRWPPTTMKAVAEGMHQQEVVSLWVVTKICWARDRNTPSETWGEFLANEQDRAKRARPQKHSPPGLAQATLMGMCSI